ncbi:MAG: DUF2779 domain-containing protein [Alphaproteobacteria bacterium]|nr:DUF2779 domain-containing protein [Alphaproteobacteria bacterium]
MHILNKSDFIHFRQCPSSLWLKKNKPEVYAKYKKADDPFLENLAKQGYAVETLARTLFPDGIFLDEHDPHALELTKKTLSTHHTFFQPSFSANGFYARADILLRDEKNETYHIIEVKSSSKIKKDKNHSHIEDVAFQAWVLEQAGYTVSSMSIIHINTAYIKQGEVDVKKLLTQTDVTEEARESMKTLVPEIKQAFDYIQLKDIPLDSCQCLYTTKSNHCDTFSYFNTTYTKQSVHYLIDIRKEKLKIFLDAGIHNVVDIPITDTLNNRQASHVLSAIHNRPIIQREDIKEIIDSLVYPLYFIDYEAVSTAIPIIDGTHPYQQIPFQFSLHILNKNGEITHHEYIAEELVLPDVLVQTMKKYIGDTGSVVVWYETFEGSRNREMMEMFPHHLDFLADINSRLFDLRDIFYKYGYYIDYRTCGSTSIKYVLPVLCPDLSYDTLAIQNGTSAMESWQRMITLPHLERNILKKDLLAYCERDSFAMIRIFQELKKLTS